MKSVCRGLKASRKLEMKIDELQNVSNEVNRCLQGIESNILGGGWRLNSGRVRSRPSHEVPLAG